MSARPGWPPRPRKKHWEWTLARVVLDEDARKVAADGARVAESWSPEPEFTGGYRDSPRPPVSLPKKASRWRVFCVWLRGTFRLCE